VKARGCIIGMILIPQKQARREHPIHLLNLLENQIQVITHTLGRMFCVAICSYDYYCIETPTKMPSKEEEEANKNDKETPNKLQQQIDKEAENMDKEAAAKKAQEEEKKKV
jgi:hypothetical protein